MKLAEHKPSIANLRDMLARGELIANKDYQRAPGLWPNASRSYFIDTILEGFPFPKIYFHEFLDKKTKRVRTEIVDGQQRITTIQDYLDDKFALGQNATKFAGLRFSQLEEEVQDRFLFYTVSIEVIREADRAEILQMFRRMNAHTLPLNSAEKRHSEFFGEFKDMVTRVLDRTTLLSKWEVFTTRQTLRLADAEFFADLVLAMLEGVGSTSNLKLHNLYKKFDASFPMAEKIEEEISTVFSFIGTELSELQGSYMVKKPAALYSLFCALYHLKYGLPNFSEATGIASTGNFLGCPLDKAKSNLFELAAAHEMKDVTRFPSYVEAVSAGTNREKQRMERIRVICLALNDNLIGS